ncbi:hypothetical protein PF005_g21132 [Phytophthora fragariae]|uniref:RxLR effector protein n=1 Tax=Phytophthora fragariae TaxID=53985 RepID=A0A6A3E3P8_9STRA|nr:hypothetical protein PF009_g25338 [Phytophthora fragariae]KAE9185742.1 hypothetical protein PF005_g21132 [Phytophthora fragariae]KAE9193571.1 hypothetical protein PF002_g23866 [Phytophthora fragariae]
MAPLSTRLRASLCSFALLAFSFSWNSAARRKATSLCRLLSRHHSLAPVGSLCPRCPCLTDSVIALSVDRASQP